MPPKIPAWVAAKARASAKAKAAARIPKAKAKPRAAASSSSKAPAPKRKATAAATAPAGKVRRTGSSDSVPKAPARGKKGGKKVDEHVPGAGAYKVYEDYAVKLNQTNVAGNNNKFYIIQVLVRHGEYASWNRWGRVGEVGATKFQPCATVEQAIKAFESKFREKTSNSWDNAFSDFKPKKGKYIIVETDDAGGGGGALGKLTAAQIAKGQAVLDKIEVALKKKGANLDDLSSQYFSLIPHDFGRKRPTSIKTQELLEQQQELLKFYLRMGFEEVETSAASPVEGVMELPVPSSLDDAANAVVRSKDSIKASNKKGSELAKKQVGKPRRKMTEKEYAAIMLYTSNAIYKDLNQALRDNNRSKVKKYFKYLRLFFESMDALPKQKRKLWRGLSVDLHKNPQYKVGGTVVWWGISSCTSDEKVAKGFAYGCGGKATVITVESKTAADISQVTFFSNEKESLLSPGTELKVKSNKMNGNVCEITLEEVGRQLN